MSQRFKLVNRENVRREVVPRGFIDGLIMKNGTDATNDIDLGIGEATLVDSSSNNERLLVFQDSVVTKRSDLDWTDGTGGGGLASGARSLADTLDATTWYHYFIISKGDGRRTDGGFDTSLTAANLLADATEYGFYRRVGSIFANSGNTIDKFFQFGDEFYWDQWDLTFSDTVPATTIQTQIMRTPLGVVTYCSVQGWYSQGTAGRWIYLKSTDQTDVAASASIYHLAATAVGGTEPATFVHIKTDTSSVINWRGNSATGTLHLTTVGWTDPRGRTWI